MRALVVYESMFGSTRVVAHALADGLPETWAAEVVEVGHAPSALPDDLDLLLVAAPTHVMGLSRPWTRRAAARQRPVISAGRGVREWLADLSVSPDAKEQCSAAAASTRLVRDRPPGSAATRIQSRLARKGLRLPVPPETFWVRSGAGDLLTGELDRAREWAGRLAALTQHPQERSWEHTPTTAVGGELSGRPGLQVPTGGSTGTSEPSSWREGRR